VDTYRKIEPGDAVELDVWDGRALIDCVQKYDCDPSWPGLGQVDEHVFRASPQGPGTYEIKVGYAKELPEGCTASDGDTFRCFGYVSYGGFPGLVFELCPSPAYATATIALSATGEVIATLALD
jgi:hypothetical protein